MVKKMNKMPKRIDSFMEGNMDALSNKGYTIEYDGWHFCGTTMKVTVNKVLKYIFSEGEI